MVDFHTIKGNSGVIKTDSTTKGSTQSSDTETAADGIEQFFKFDKNNDYFITATEAAESNMSEEQLELANEALAKRRAAHNNDVAEIASMKAASTQPTEAEIVQQFDNYDDNGNHKISAKEYTNALAQDWLNNKEIQKGYGNITDYLDSKYEEFKRFAGDDDVMNIDEFTNMVFSRLAQQNRPPMNIVDELAWAHEKVGQIITNDDGTEYKYTDSGVEVKKHDEHHNLLSETIYDQNGELSLNVQHFYVISENVVNRTYQTFPLEKFYN